MSRKKIRNSLTYAPLPPSNFLPNNYVLKEESENGESRKWKGSVWNLPLTGSFHSPRLPRQELSLFSHFSPLPPPFKKSWLERKLKSLLQNPHSSLSYPTSFREPGATTRIYSKMYSTVSHSNLDNGEFMILHYLTFPVELFRRIQQRVISCPFSKLSHWNQTLYVTVQKEDIENIWADLSSSMPSANGSNEIETPRFCNLITYTSSRRSLVCFWCFKFSRLARQ